MDANEYLAFLPLLIYGLALSDLLSQWKRFFDFESFYLPYMLFTIFLTELAIYNVYVYLELVSEFSKILYYQYLLGLIPPFLFMLTVNIFTPEKEDDTKKYFLLNKSKLFFLLALFMGSHFLYNFNETTYVLVGRIIGLSFLIILGFIKKEWTIYLVILIWLIIFLDRSKIFTL